MSDLKDNISYLGIIKAIALFIFSGSVVHGSVKQGLQTFFDTMGYRINVTGAGGYHGQRGGYYTPGSIFARSPVKNAQVLGLQMPDMRAGCGGIDLFTGGFSYIDSKELIHVLKSIGQNASAYAFGLALQTVTPQIKAVIDELSAKLQDINNMNINSCQSAAALVGGLWPKSEASSKMLCQSMGTGEGNRFKDWAAARQGCGAGGERHDINRHKREGFQDILEGDFNLTWQAINKNSFLKQDPALAAFFMTLSGTVIGKEQGGRFYLTHLPAHASSEDLIQVLMKGGTLSQAYQCRDPEKCLDLTTIKVVLEPSHSLYAKLVSMLEELVRKVREDVAITQEELDLIQSTHLPIFKILSVQAAFGQGGSPLTTSTIAEAVAYDMVVRYISRVLDIVETSLKNLESVQINNELIQAFQKGLYHTRQRLMEQRQGAYQQMMTHFHLIKRVQQIESYLHLTFSEGEDSE